MNDHSPRRCENCKEAAVIINRGGSPSSLGRNSRDRGSRNLISWALGVGDPGYDETWVGRKIGRVRVE